MAQKSDKHSFERIDLHGFSVTDALIAFIEHCNRCVSNGHKGSVEVIHGYGSSGIGGGIRSTLRHYLKIHAKRFDHITLGDDLANPGITIVYPLQRLPMPVESEKPSAGDASDQRHTGSMSEIEMEVLGACIAPKTQEKVVAKLHGWFCAPAIRAALGRLVQIGVVEEVGSGSEKQFRTK